MNFLKKIFGKNDKPTQHNNDIVVKTSEETIDIINKNYFRNLELLVDYEILLDSYCDISDSWEAKPFIDDNYTLREIYKRIQAILSNEYNEYYCEMIKLKDYKNENLKSIILNLEKQYIQYKTQKDIIEKLEDSLLNTLL